MKNKSILTKMVHYMDKIMNYCAGYNYQKFIENDMLVEATVFNLSQIGELTTKLGESFRLSHDEIPWNQLHGLRNRIVHDYEGVNLTLVWSIIEDDLEPTKALLKRVLSHMEDEQE